MTQLWSSVQRRDRELRPLAAWYRPSVLVMVCPRDLDRAACDHGVIQIHSVQFSLPLQYPYRSSYQRGAAHFFLEARLPWPFFGGLWPSCFRSASFSCLSWLSAWLGLGFGLGLAPGQDKPEAGSGARPRSPLATRALATRALATPETKLGRGGQPKTARRCYQHRWRVLLHGRACRTSGCFARPVVFCLPDGSG